MNSKDRSSYFTCSFPSKFDLVFLVNICSLDLAIITFNNIFIFEMPSTWSFWLIVIKIAFEVSSILVKPFTFGHLSISKITNVFHSSFKEDISTLTFFFSIFPWTRINILICVNHNTLAVSQAVFPISLIAADSCVNLDSNSVFFVFFPLTHISVLYFFCSFLRISISTITRS